MKALDLRGLSPAPVTPFTLDGAVDFAAIQRLGSWLGSIDGVRAWSSSAMLERARS